MQPGSAASTAAGLHHTYRGRLGRSLSNIGRGQARQGLAHQQTDRLSAPAAALTASRTSKCWLYRATLASTCARGAERHEG